MASISANGSLGHHNFKLTVTESSTSTENNTSTIKYSFQLSPIQTSWAWEQWGSSISYTITINGTKYTGTIPNYDGYATVTLKSGSQTVTHNSDGSKSISYSFSVVDGAGQRYTPGNASASSTLALTTIPRATTPTLSASTITVNGSNYVNITITPASNTFKHKIRYAFGSLTGQSSGVAIGSDFSAKGNVTVKFTPPTSVLSQIPSVKSGTCTITCYTYTSDGTKIGSKTVNLTFNVPTYTPTASIKLTGNKLLSNTYVQGKSTVTVETTASTSYGATIKSYSSTIEGKTYTSNKFTTAALSSGDKTISVKVTDTRGNTYTASATKFTVYSYSAPKITEFTLARQSVETTVRAAAKGTIASVNGVNTYTLRVTLNGTTKQLSSLDSVTTFENVDTDKTYTATATLTDKYTTVTKTFTLPTVAVTMDFHSSGKGVAFGKVAEDQNLLDLAWDLKVNDRKITLTRSKEDIEAMYYAERSDKNRRIGFGVGAGGINRGVYDYFLDKWVLKVDDESVSVNGMEFSDSGWKSVSFNSNFTTYNTDTPMQYRRVGKQVYIRGAMQPTTTLDTSTELEAFVLPVGYRPSQWERFVCQGSNSNKWLCTVTNAGKVMVSRYGTTEYGKISANTWLPISISFLVD